MLLAANAYYLSTAPDSATEVGRYAAAIQSTVPVMLDIADDEFQRLALNGLRERAATFAGGIDDLAGDFAKETKLLQSDIDGSTADLSLAVESLTSRVRAVERAAQARFDETLSDAARKLSGVSLAFVALVVFFGVAVSKSISEPLLALRGEMLAIADGDYGRAPLGIDAPDQIGDMARAVEVFRQNALAKLRTDEMLRTAKERAETALADLRTTQASLIESEKLAALGGLVAGVAHEVNNPVGVGLTVASSLAHRCKAISAELASGPVRRSRLNEFIGDVQAAAGMIVSNLYRASDLVEAFKQVAVDRSSHHRRQFDLKEACEQVTASLRPGLRVSHSLIALVVEIPEGIVMDSYPGPLGQVVTNLFLNAVRHAYRPGETGEVRLSADRQGTSHVVVTFSDDGLGMPGEVRKRAFEPFFTTNRGEGGTGLGLHIVFNIVTHQLGGRVTLASEPGAGSRFVMTLPLVAPAVTEEAWRPRFA